MARTRTVGGGFRFPLPILIGLAFVAALALVASATVAFWPEAGAPATANTASPAAAAPAAASAPAAAQANPATQLLSASESAQWAEIEAAITEARKSKPGYSPPGFQRGDRENPLLDASPAKIMRTAGWAVVYHLHMDGFKAAHGEGETPLLKTLTPSGGASEWLKVAGRFPADATIVMDPWSVGENTHSFLYDYDHNVTVLTSKSKVVINGATFWTETKFGWNYSDGHYVLKELNVYSTPPAHWGGGYG